GVSWAADLSDNAVTLEGNKGSANAFTITTAVNNGSDLGIGTYRLDWTNSPGGFTTSERISITVLGTTYQSGTSSANTDDARFDAAAATLATTLTNAGYTTTYNTSNNYFDITIASSSAV